MDIKDIIKKRRKELDLTLLDIAKACGVSEATASRWESGDIGDMKRSRIASLAKILKVSPSVIVGTVKEDELPLHFTDIAKIPLYSSISCGTGLFIDEDIDDYISIPNKNIKKGREYFANYAQGDSMINKGISDGDVLVFERTNVLENGQIGSFCIDNETNVCKIYRKLNNGMILLESANENYSPIEIDITDGTCFRVIGKLVGSFKQY